MNRKLNLFHTVTTIFWVVVTFSCESQKKAIIDSTAQKPNIVFILADDMSTQAISAYGGIFKDIAPTPHIDRLANEGMLFQDVICTNAICGPSRAAILTSKYAHQNGFYKNENGGNFDASQWTFPQEFQKNGYQTALFGKWHLGSEPKGFDVFKYHNSSAQQGMYWNPVYNINGKDQKFEGYATNLETDFAIDWLSNERNTSQPFMMCLQYKAPHRPWEPDKKYENLWDSIEMPYPDTFWDDYKTRERTAGDTEMTMDYFSRRDMKLETPKELKGKDKLQWEFYGAKKDEIVQPDELTADEGKKWRYQTYIKDYLACIKSIDDNIGRVLDYLDANHLTENTIVIITSDQGFFLGEHGFFDKRFIYEESVRMPFIMRYPAKIKPRTSNHDLISNIDFAPTLLDFAGINSSETIQGQSFKNAVLGKASSNGQQGIYYHYYEFPYWHHVQPHYGIRTQQFTLAHFYYNMDVWELYDLTSDPNQLNNVYNNPIYSQILAQLKNELHALQVKYEDDKSLEEFRKITDTDFGKINSNKNEINVQEIITK